MTADADQYQVAAACDGVQSVGAVRRERPDLILIGDESLAATA